MTTNLVSSLERSRADLLPFFIDFTSFGLGPSSQESKEALGAATKAAQVEMLLREAWKLLEGQIDSIPSKDSNEPEFLHEFVRDAARILSEHHRFSPNEIESAKYELVAVVYGLGPLQRLYEDNRIVEIRVKGPKSIDCVTLDGRIVSTNVSFRSPIEYEYFAAKWVPENWEGGIYEVLLEDGQQTVLVCSSFGDSYSLVFRIPRLSAYQMSEYIRFKTIPAGVALWLSELVALGQANVLVVGPPSAGKTGLLTTLTGVVDSAQRVTIIEPIPEIQAKFPLFDGHLSATASELGLPVLAKTCAGGRMVVGELDRSGGGELFLEASEAGFRGNLGAMLGDSVETALESYVRSIHRGEWSDFSARRIAKSVDLVIHLGFSGDDRRLLGIYEIEQRETGFDITPIVTFMGEPYGDIIWEISGLPSVWVEKLKQLGCYLEEGRYVRLAEGAVL